MYLTSHFLAYGLSPPGVSADAPGWRALVLCSWEEPVQNERGDCVPVTDMINMIDKKENAVPPLRIAESERRPGSECLGRGKR
ncbi:hypothetical protein DRO48_00795 [Candidatus Bathyarchaeota archaeon]|nr:MAG: hypothetical protein DRO48_00795 [Candidatus Bathyarchaeota archaeon]